MTQNFQPDELQAMYGGTAAVLSISAGTGKEQSLTTQMTLRYQPNLKNVLWGVHPGSYSAGKDVIKGNSFPSYLYDEYWLNDIFYLFNVSTFKKSLKDVRGDSNGHYADWRGLQNWHGRYKYGCPSALRLQLDRRGLPQPADDWLGSLDNIRANVSQNLYAVVKENPEVNFTFFFPPFSNLYWNLLAERQPQRFEAYRTTMLEVVTQLLDQPNVEIYDFSSISSITDNLNNYRDLTHFSGTISSRLLAYISNGEYRISDKHKFLKRFETMPLNKSNIKSVISDCLSS